MNSTVRWRRCSGLITDPSAMSDAANGAVVPSEVVVAAPLAHPACHAELKWPSTMCSYLSLSRALRASMTFSTLYLNVALA